MKLKYSIFSSVPTEVTVDERFFFFICFIIESRLLFINLKEYPHFSMFLKDIF